MYVLESKYNMIRLSHALVLMLLVYHTILVVKTSLTKAEIEPLFDDSLKIIINTILKNYSTIAYKSVKPH